MGGFTGIGRDGYRWEGVLSQTGTPKEPEDLINLAYLQDNIDLFQGITFGVGADGYSLDIYRNTDKLEMYLDSGGQVNIGAVAGSGSGNLAFYADGEIVFNDNVNFNSTHVSGYNGIVTEGFGIPPILDVVQLSNQNTDIAPTALTNCDVAGLYEISAVATCTQNDATAGTLTLKIAFTGDEGATSNAAIRALTGKGHTVGVWLMQLASGNITYETTHTGAYNNAIYRIDITAKRII